MAVKDVIKVSRKTFFNPKAWLGYDIVKTTTVSLWGSLRAVFKPRALEPQQAETFEQAVSRLNLSDENVREIQFTFLSYAILFGVIAVAVLVYCGWLLFHGHFLATILGLSVIALLLSQVFRYHFWYFQIKHRKLGCTYQEWRSGKVTPSGVKK